MGKYIVTITPEAHGGPGADGLSLTVHIDGDAGVPRVTGMAIRTSARNGLTRANLLYIDLRAIAQALAIKEMSPTRQSQLSLFDYEVAEPQSRQAVAAAFARPASATGSAFERNVNHPEVEPAALPSSIGDINGRVYRRMPDPDELRANFEIIGTVTGLAKKYGVPRHTAQGWMGRLRKINSPVQAATDLKVK
ncbi:hypothetical protein [Nocardia panacis]|uniref:hypothetical protein n=1 Tax=Nocardia panacis TaxID=2340916 RepID=UPI0011C475AF|nr:hypothetical protein [Nocardia panacis]